MSHKRCLLLTKAQRVQIVESQRKRHVRKALCRNADRCEQIQLAPSVLSNHSNSSPMQYFRECSLVSWNWIYPNGLICLQIWCQLPVKSTWRTSAHDGIKFLSSSAKFHSYLEVRHDDFAFHCHLLTKQGHSSFIHVVSYPSNQRLKPCNLRNFYQVFCGG